MSTPRGKRLIGNRYMLEDMLGFGGMGTVYRATDRLATDPDAAQVALKQLHSVPDVPVDPDGTEPQGSSHDRLSLAREFRLLASLRHPNIISVLDYGFDIQPDTHARQPFFTMTLLRRPQTLQEAAQPLDDAGRVRLFVEMLQALAYLHRCGIVHRDVKPGNVLVDDTGAVRVLDFGLAAPQGHSEDGPGGTLYYMSPEAVQGMMLTEAADLYAVGVMLYEMFVGTHPFAASAPTQILIDILSKAPDLTPLPAAYRALVGRLLQKDPDDRYPNAQAVIAALCQAAGVAQPRERDDVRESFLQSARFVGREAPLSRLEGALQRTLSRTPQGAVWLIAGESGVGKSRLLDELRIRALISEGEGGVMTVLRGEGQPGGGAPYEFWRDPVRQLLLTTEVSDLEAGILREVVPDIERVLGRPVPPAPSVTPQLAQQRLTLTIAALFQRQRRPMLLILEDLQWAEESLEPLKVLARIVDDLPLLIVGSYRDDEAPSLPDQLPPVQTERLERLNSDAIAALSRAMLGESGDRQQVLDLLNRETEGNAFFLVEVVRALAEDAGSLEEIGYITLPPSVFAQGIQALVAHRLERLPTWARDLLQLAAVAGRVIDPVLMRTLGRDLLAANDSTLDDWLTLCVNGAVLAAEGTRWRFTHEKMREGLLAGVGAAERERLSLQVAQAIETVFAAELEPYYNDLADHFGHTSDTQAARRYAHLAARAAADRFAHRDALHYVNQALALTERDDPLRFDLLQLRASVADTQGDRVVQAADLGAMADLADRLDDDLRRAQVALQEVRYYLALGDTAQALAHGQRARDLAAGLGDAALQAEAIMGIAQAHNDLPDFDAARIALNEGLALAESADLKAVLAEGLHMRGTIAYRQTRKLDEAARDYARARELYAELLDLRGEARSRNSLGNATSDQGDMEAARSHYEAALALYQQMGDALGEADVLTNLAIFSHASGDPVTAVQHLLRARQVYRQINANTRHAAALTNLGAMLYNLGDAEAARRHLDAALRIRHQMDDRRGAAITAVNLAMLYQITGDHTTAITYADQVIAAGTALAIPMLSVYGRNNRAISLVALRRHSEAESLLNQVIAEWDEMGAEDLKLEATAHLAGMRHDQGRADEALALITPVYDALTAGKLDSAEGLMTMMRLCWKVLDHHQDDRAPALLRQARDLLLERAAEISDPDLRAKFLENLPHHRAILAAWEHAEGAAAQE